MKTNNKMIFDEFYSQAKEVIPELNDAKNGKSITKINSVNSAEIIIKRDEGQNFAEVNLKPRDTSERQFTLSTNSLENIPALKEFAQDFTKGFDGSIKDYVDNYDYGKFENTENILGNYQSKGNEPKIELPELLVENAKANVDEYQLEKAKIKADIDERFGANELRAGADSDFYENLSDKAKSRAESADASLWRNRMLSSDKIPRFLLVDTFYGVYQKAYNREFDGNPTDGYTLDYTVGYEKNGKPINIKADMYSEPADLVEGYTVIDDKGAETYLTEDELRGNYTLSTDSSGFSFKEIDTLEPLNKNSKLTFGEALAKGKFYECVDAVVFKATDEKYHFKDLYKYRSEVFEDANKKIKLASAELTDIDNNTNRRYSHKYENSVKDSACDKFLNLLDGLDLGRQIDLRENIAKEEAKYEVYDRQGVTDYTNVFEDTNLTAEFLKKYNDSYDDFEFDLEESKIESAILKSGLDNAEKVYKANGQEKFVNGLSFMGSSIDLLDGPVLQILNLLTLPVALFTKNLEGFKRRAHAINTFVPIFSSNYTRTDACRNYNNYIKSREEFLTKKANLEKYDTFQKLKDAVDNNELTSTEKSVYLTQLSKLEDAINKRSESEAKQAEKLASKVEKGKSGENYKYNAERAEQFSHSAKFYSTLLDKVRELKETLADKPEKDEKLEKDKEQDATEKLNEMFDKMSDELEQNSDDVEDIEKDEKLEDAEDTDKVEDSDKVEDTDDADQSKAEKDTAENTDEKENPDEIQDDADNDVDVDEADYSEYSDEIDAEDEEDGDGYVSENEYDYVDPMAGVDPEIIHSVSYEEVPMEYQKEFYRSVGINVDAPEFVDYDLVKSKAEMLGADNARLERIKVEPHTLNQAINYGFIHKYNIPEGETRYTTNGVDLATALENFQTEMPEGYDASDYVREGEDGKLECLVDWGNGPEWVAGDVITQVRGAENPLAMFTPVDKSVIDSPDWAFRNSSKGEMYKPAMKGIEAVKFTGRNSLEILNEFGIDKKDKRAGTYVAEVNGELRVFSLEAQDEGQLLKKGDILLEGGVQHELYTNSEKTFTKKNPEFLIEPKNPEKFYENHAEKPKSNDEVDKLKNDIENYKAKIAELEGKLDAVEAKNANLEAINDKIDNLSNDVKNLAEKIDSEPMTVTKVEGNKLKVEDYSHKDKMEYTVGTRNSVFLNAIEINSDDNKMRLVFDKDAAKEIFGNERISFARSDLDLSDKETCESMLTHVFENATPDNLKAIEFNGNIIDMTSENNKDKLGNFLNERLNQDNFDNACGELACYLQNELDNIDTVENFKDIDNDDKTEKHKSKNSEEKSEKDDKEEKDNNTEFDSFGDTVPANEIYDDQDFLDNLNEQNQDYLDNDFESSDNDYDNDYDF